MVRVEGNILNSLTEKKNEMKKKKHHVYTTEIRVNQV